MFFNCTLEWLHPVPTTSFYVYVIVWRRYRTAKVRGRFLLPKDVSVRVFLRVSVLLILSKKVWGNGNQTVHAVYAKPTCYILVLCTKHVWYWNKNIFYFVIYMLYSRCIYIFPHWKVDAVLETKWLADLLN